MVRCKFHLVEHAIKHNLAQPFRTLSDDSWMLVMTNMSNRDTSRVALVCRYFNALARARTPIEGMDPECTALLANPSFSTSSAPLRLALYQFQRGMMLCVFCEREANPCMYALPDCKHAVCCMCWSAEAARVEESVGRSTEGENVWSLFYLKCRACGCRNEMDDGSWKIKWTHGVHTLSDRMLRKLDCTTLSCRNLQESIRDPVWRNLHVIGVRDPDPVAQRVAEMAARFRRLHVFLLDRYGNASVARAVRRELAAGATFLARAMGVTERSVRPAWE